MEYRPEINGLRALAVLPVILFHAGFGLFSGGFVGVDIFFVISGFLITTLILNDLHNDRFTLLNFYERRARRILPALFLVIFTVLPFSWFWLNPSDLKDLSQSMVSVALFSSNILFWLESGYFEQSAELKPLLHTWSLAVEEQFYIFFPVLLCLIWRCPRRFSVIVLVSIFFLSLVTAHWGAYGAPSATFYLLHARAWELLAGALVAQHIMHRSPDDNPITENVLSSIGLLMIAASIFLFDDSTPFPSLYALVPVIGTLLVIIYAKRGTLAKRLLESKPLVGLGLISYSAYLWHQPLFAFARLRSIVEPPVYIMSLLAALSIVLAYFSWRYVEQICRGSSGRVPNRANTIIFSVLGSSSLLLIGGLGHLTDGFRARLSPQQLEIESYKNYPRRQEVYRTGDCLLQSNQRDYDFADKCSAENGLFLWGDSHAAGLYFGMSSNQATAQFTISGCPPFLDLEIPDVPNCKENNRGIAERISASRPEIVVLHGLWAGHTENQLRSGLSLTLNYIAEQSPETQVFVLGGVPHWGSAGLPNYLVNQLFRSDGGLVGVERYLPADLEKVMASDEQLQAIVDSTNGSAFFVSLLSFLCEGDKCLSLIKNETSFVPFAWDFAHLTAEGSKYVADEVMGIIREPVPRTAFRNKSISPGVTRQVD